MTFEYRPAITLTACDLCGGSNLRPIAHSDRYGLPVQTTLCETCGMLQINPRMSAAQYGEFYATGTYRRLVGELYAKHGKHEYDPSSGMQQYAANVADWLDGNVPTGGTFLDIGGSTGIVADTLSKRFGWQPTVMDPAGGELSHAAELGIPVIQASVEEWEPTEQFDVIGMFQTADHLLSVREALSRIRRALKPGGRFIVDICEFRVLCLGKSPDLCIKLDHPSMLTSFTFAAYLVRAGFRVIQHAQMNEFRKMFCLCELAEPMPGYLPPQKTVGEIKRVLGVRDGSL